MGWIWPTEPYHPACTVGLILDQHATYGMCQTSPSCSTQHVGLGYAACNVQVQGQGTLHVVHGTGPGRQLHASPVLEQPYTLDLLRRAGLQAPFSQLLSPVPFIQPMDWLHAIHPALRPSALMSSRWWPWLLTVSYLVCSFINSSSVDGKLSHSELAAF